MSINNDWNATRNHNLFNYEKKKKNHEVLTF